MYKIRDYNHFITSKYLSLRQFILPISSVTEVNTFFGSGPHVTDSHRPNVAFTNYPVSMPTHIARHEETRQRLGPNLTGARVPHRSETGDPPLRGTRALTGAFMGYSGLHPRRERAGQHRLDRRSKLHSSIPPGRTRGRTGARFDVINADSGPIRRPEIKPPITASGMLEAFPRRQDFTAGS